MERLRNDFYFPEYGLLFDSWPNVKVAISSSASDGTNPPVNLYVSQPACSHGYGSSTTMPNILIQSLLFTRWFHHWIMSERHDQTKHLFVRVWQTLLLSKSFKNVKFQLTRLVEAELDLVDSNLMTSTNWWASTSSKNEAGKPSIDGGQTTNNHCIGAGAKKSLFCWSSRNMTEMCVYFQSHTYCRRSKGAWSGQNIEKGNFRSDCHTSKCFDVDI